MHYARMGEPSWNFEVLHSVDLIKSFIESWFTGITFHPVVSTMLPRHNHYLRAFLEKWCDVKNHDLKGNAGLQLSINSTDDKVRDRIFSKNSVAWKQMRVFNRFLPKPFGRKYALNFAVCPEWPIDAKKLSATFDPEKFMVKLTPMHITDACRSNNISTPNGYSEYCPYKEKEEALKDAGFDVLVFVPSIEEDESKITCGNAILAERSKNETA